MSSALAIAAVSAVIKDVLLNGVVKAALSTTLGTSVDVSVLPPDKVVTGGTEPSQLNLFMYAVTPNVGWSNVGLPTRNGAGERVSNPPLALNLHYLVTAYGAEAFHAEILLGHAMQLLHAVPVLTRPLITKALTPPATPPPIVTALATAGLAEQVEMIKICPQAMNTEEVSKLWSALQTAYRPSAAYEVTVVLIETERPVKPTLPVLERNIYAVPFRQPVIEQVIASGPQQVVVTGQAAILLGRQLRGDITTVRIGGQVATTTAITDSRIEATLPGGLLAGVQGAQVIHELRIGTPPVAHPGVEGSVTPFVLHPRITQTGSGATATYNITTTTTPATATAPATTTITVQLDPVVGKAQRVLLELLQFSDAQLMRIVEAPARAADTSAIRFTFSDLAPGDYLVRVRVDGAETLLEVDANHQSIKPKLTLP